MHWYVSEGTAAVLGLLPVRLDAAPTTAYLMTGEHCARDCAFCAQARSSRGRAHRLSRVIWPPFAVAEVLPRLVDACRAGRIRRVCFQVVHSAGYFQRVRQAVAAVRREVDIPLCVSVGLQTVEEVGELLEEGVDVVGLPLDAATPQLYRELKGGSWERHLRLLQKAAARFPGRVGTHLIIGLGESEEEAIRLMGELLSCGVGVALFAFTPLPGTRLEHHRPPDLRTYRRIQAAHYLLKRGLVRPGGIKFEGGRLVDWGIPREELTHHLADGEAFRTTGCPDCNRPYYNERPGKTPYNYPRPLQPREAGEAVKLVLEGGK
ncbi:radical SAM protein [Desulfofundulus thermocisternus]|uniref:radical SAM protein n=1 Tax=Desulfofundulus thermocisternus TaxID=42471 RepID=UPI00217E920D|nr:radical SAM protein [Desulfofundulus thermocisternus]MCS5697141.1 radical SAM protein [Desulfofundulus thermocisternus]